jgi:hypothetical protein
MNKIKKIIAVLTVVCLLFGFAAVPVSAAYIADVDYSIPEATYIRPTITVEELLNSPGRALFTQPQSMALYPGEALETTIRFTNPGNIWDVSLAVRELNQNTDYGTLADVLDFRITRNDGNNAPIYNSLLSDYRPAHNDNARLRHRFQAGDTVEYTFRVYFNPENLIKMIEDRETQGKTKDEIQNDINDYMARQAMFELVITVGQVTTYVPFFPPGPGGSGPGGPIETIPGTVTPPSVPTEEPDIYEDVTDSEIPLVPGQEPEPTPPETPIDEIQTMAISEFGELIYLEDDEVPLGEFLDFLPTTGDPTSPSPRTYDAMTGLLLILAGAVAIVATVKRKKAGKA